MSKLSKTLQIKIENLGNVKVYSLDPNKRFTVGYKHNNSLQLFGAKIPKQFDLVCGKGKCYYLTVHESTVGEITIFSRAPR